MFLDGKYLCERGAGAGILGFYTSVDRTFLFGRLHVQSAIWFFSVGPGP